LALSDLFARRRKEDSDAADLGGADSPIHPTKALGRFLASLSSRSQPVLLDLGPVVGTNVTFFGEQLGCKILVENLFKDVDRHVREDKLSQLPAFLAQRFPQEAGSIDGILCWDIFDYLDRPARKPLADQLIRVLKPEGTLLAFFNATEAAPVGKPAYTKHIVVDRGRLQHRPYLAARPRQRPMVNRDIQRLFDPLRITEQFLLQTNFREVLFRKPAASAMAPAALGSGG
jgi:hypothetical protein